MTKLAALSAYSLARSLQGEKQMNDKTLFKYGEEVEANVKRKSEDKESVRVGNAVLRSDAKGKVCGLVPECVCVCVSVCACVCVRACVCL